MKLMFVLPFVLLLGLIIGGWAPKEELRSAKKENAELRQKLASREKDTRADAFTHLVQIPDRAKKPTSPALSKAAPTHANVPDDTLKDVDLTAASSAATNKAGISVTAPGTNAKEFSPEDLSARIEEAKELWKTRVEIARAQWIDRLKLPPEAAVQFDAAINAMNEELYTSMQGLADALQTGGNLTPELGTRFFNEMTMSLVKTYDDLDAFVPAEQRGEAAKLELTDFIDPAVAEPLIAVQDKLSDMPGPGREGRRRQRSLP